MKYVDLGFQTIIIVLSIVFLPVIDLYSIMLGAFALGVVQVISSMVSVIGRSKYCTWKAGHLIISLLYILLFNNISLVDEVLPPNTIGVIMIGIPALLAIYYYILSIMTIFNRAQKQNKFLPHISF